MKLSLIAAALLLSGCSSHMFQIDEKIPETITVTWARVSEAELKVYCAGSTLRIASATPNPVTVVACASVNLGDRKCTIYTAKAVSETVIGHEFLHCYLGRFHY